MKPQIKTGLRDCWCILRERVFHQRINSSLCISNAILTDTKESEKSEQFRNLLADVLLEGRPPQESAGPSMVITWQVDRGKLWLYRIVLGKVKLGCNNQHWKLHSGTFTFAHLQNSYLANSIMFIVQSRAITSLCRYQITHVSILTETG